MRLWMARGGGFAFSVLCFSFALQGCGSADHSSPLPTQTNNSAGIPVASLGINYTAAIWSQVGNSKPWTDAVVSAIRKQIASFELARDVEDFCPGYAKASVSSREICWLRLVGGVVRYESNFNPSDSFKEPSGDVSVGLLALSPNECPNAPTVDALKDPVENLICGITIMARLIKADGFIDGPPSGRGASAYWSTLRAPYISGKYHLGKKDQIIPMTKIYLTY